MKKTRKHKASFDVVFKILKQAIIDSKITITELSDTIDVDNDVLNLIFNNETEVITAISKLLELSKIDIFYYKKVWRLYKIKRTNYGFTIKRIVAPYFTVKYDVSTCEFYNFKYKKQQTKQSEYTKKVLMNEVRVLINKLL